MYKKIALVLVILIVSSAYVFAQIGGKEGTESQPEGESCPTTVKEIDPNSQTKTPECEVPQETQVKDFPDNGHILPTERFSIIPGSGLSATKITTDSGEYKNIENLKTENGNIIADYLEFEAIKQATSISAINNLDNTKISFRIPKGGSIRITNKDGVFEAAASKGVEEE